MASRITTQVGIMELNFMWMEIIDFLKSMISSKSKALKMTWSSINQNSKNLVVCLLKRQSKNYTFDCILIKSSQPIFWCIIWWNGFLRLCTSKMWQTKSIYGNEWSSISRMAISLFAYVDKMIISMIKTIHVYYLYSILEILKTLV